MAWTAGPQEPHGRPKADQVQLQPSWPAWPGWPASCAAALPSSAWQAWRGASGRAELMGAGSWGPLRPSPAAAGPGGALSHGSTAAESRCARPWPGARGGEWSKRADDVEVEGGSPQPAARSPPRPGVVAKQPLLQAGPRPQVPRAPPHYSRCLCTSRRLQHQRPSSLKYQPRESSSLRPRPSPRPACALSCLARLCPSRAPSLPALDTPRC